ncbi:hypothetical protein [Nesterenkonia alba]|uniref:hypothetical protein n=1 Tax=Nesterenkonia alba TaxID=515814 RepID=UPI0003B59382|nr:hypothetical protein [Nesterenkonia alba]
MSAAEYRNPDEIRAEIKQAQETREEIENLPDAEYGKRFGEWQWLGNKLTELQDELELAEFQQAEDLEAERQARLAENPFIEDPDYVHFEVPEEATQGQTVGKKTLGVDDEGRVQTLAVTEATPETLTEKQAEFNKLQAEIESIQEGLKEVERKRKEVVFNRELSRSPDGMTEQTVAIRRAERETKELKARLKPLVKRRDQLIRENTIGKLRNKSKRVVDNLKRDLAPENYQRTLSADAAEKEAKRSFGRRHKKKQDSAPPAQRTLGSSVNSAGTDDDHSETSLIARSRDVSNVVTADDCATDDKQGLHFRPERKNPLKALLPQSKQMSMRADGDILETPSMKKPPSKTARRLQRYFGFLMDDEDETLKPQVKKASKWTGIISAPVIALFLFYQVSWYTDPVNQEAREMQAWQNMSTEEQIEAATDGYEITVNADGDVVFEEAAQPERRSWYEWQCDESMLFFWC